MHTQKVARKANQTNQKKKNGKKNLECVKITVKMRKKRKNLVPAEMTLSLSVLLQASLQALLLPSSSGLLDV